MRPVIIKMTWKIWRLLFIKIHIGILVHLLMIETNTKNKASTLTNNKTLPVSNLVASKPIPLKTCTKPWTKTYRLTIPSHLICKRIIKWIRIQTHSTCSSNSTSSISSIHNSHSKNSKWCHNKMWIKRSWL